MKVTKEIANFIYEKYHEGIEVDKLIELVKQEFDVEIACNTAKHYSRLPFEKIKERQKEYTRRQMIREKLDSIIITLFDKEEFSGEDLQSSLLISYGVKVEQKKIEDAILSLENRVKEKSPIIFEHGKYKLNKISPYWKVCDGYWQ